jgi:hypothetical protein
LNKETEEGARDKQNTGKKITLRSSSSFQMFDRFSAQSDELLHQDLSRKRREQEVHARNKGNISGALHTSSEELVDQ